MTIGRIHDRKQARSQDYRQLQEQKTKAEGAISLDIPRTFPSLEYFKPGQPGYHELLRILKAISLSRPEVGYCQGMCFFAAVVLMVLGNEEVWWRFDI
jgi:hypothetical protein